MCTHAGEKNVFSMACLRLQAAYTVRRLVRLEAAKKSTPHERTCRSDAGSSAAEAKKAREMSAHGARSGHTLGDAATSAERSTRKAAHGASGSATAMPIKWAASRAAVGMPSEAPQMGTSAKVTVTGKQVGSSGTLRRTLCTAKVSARSVASAHARQSSGRPRRCGRSVLTTMRSMEYAPRAGTTRGSDASCRTTRGATSALDV